MKPVALFLFNSSTYAVQPWIDRGIHCVSVDYDNTDHSAARDKERTTRLHTRLSVDLSAPYATYRVKWELRKRGLQAAIVVSFAPCTDLAVSGAGHFKRKLERDPLCQIHACGMAMLASQFGVPYAVENPVSVLSSLWRKPDLYWHPYDYAGHCPEGEHPEAPNLIPEQDRYTKKSCLWTGNGFRHPVKCGMEPFSTVNPGHRALGGKSAKTKHLRSLTPRGFAYAVMIANIHIFTGQMEF